MQTSGEDPGLEKWKMVEEGQGKGVGGGWGGGKRRRVLARVGLGGLLKTLSAGLELILIDFQFWLLRCGCVEIA